MQVTVSGHHVSLTPALKDYVEEKLAKLERHAENIISTNVTLSVDKLVQKAEARVHLSGAELFADAEAQDMYAAIDDLVGKLDRQIIKRKDKHVTRKHAR
jgi:putative sigma-54 modulation protein